MDKFADKLGSVDLKPEPDRAIFDYRPEHLLRITGTEPPIPELKMAQEAASQCSYVGEMDKRSCQKSFPLFEKAISSLPSSQDELDAIWKDRGKTEQKWYSDQPISAEEKSEYMRSYDRIKGASDYRFVYGTTLNNYGFKYGDEAAKEKAKKILTEAASLSPPENYVVKGALIQARRGGKVDYQESYSEGAVQAAVQAVSLIRDTNNEKPQSYSILTNLFCGFFSCDRGPSQRQIQTNLATEAIESAITEAPDSTARIVAREVSKLNPDDGKLLQSLYKDQVDGYKKLISG